MSLPVPGSAMRSGFTSALPGFKLGGMKDGQTPFRL